MSLTPEPTTPLKRRRGLIAAGSALGVAALLAAGSTAAFAADTPTPGASTSAHAGLRAHPLLRELANDFRTGQDASARAQAIAKRIVNSPKLFAKLPANLQADLTALAGATGDDIATDAAKLKDTALAGGYGPKAQKVAERIQTRVQSKTSGSGS
jgi:hypothetical protein